jgi:hypothetical protein
MIGWQDEARDQGGALRVDMLLSIALIATAVAYGKDR